MNKYLIIVIIVLLAVIGAGWKQLQSVTGKWEVAEANVKAYSTLVGSTDDENAALQLTVSQLRYFSDSVLTELDNTRKELHIKDNSLKALQAVSSSFSRTDTIRITRVDTLFRDPSLSLDTIIGDKWYTLRLGLQYPSTVAVKPEFKSEKHIIVSTKKETINPPSKFFLFRWFQRKHYVLNVDVVEKNPYVGNQSSRYIEIIR